MNSIVSRIDAITEIPQDRRAEIIPPPRSVKIELTGSCDYKCFFCATGKNLRPKSHMDFDLFCRLAKEIREAGVEELGMFYLGESFLYPKLVDAIEYAKHTLQFPYVFLTTNGRMALREKVSACIYAGLDSLKFSFNWSDAEQMKEITQVDAFDRVIDNIRDAKHVRDKVWEHTGHCCGLYASSILYEGAQREKMEKAVRKILPYVDEHYFLPLYNQGGHTDAEERERGYVPMAGNMGRIGGLVPALPCWALFTEGHVTFDGKLSGCCFDHGGDWTMGDLTKESFLEAWNSQAFQALRKAQLDKDVAGTACENCVAYA